MEELRVLIVDDDQAVGRVLCALLSQAGYGTELATSTQHAMQLLKVAPVDLVITDLRMPDADGFALLHQAKQLCPDLPVIMLTAHGNVPIAVAAMREGASDFMLKPFEREEVIATVRRVLATHAGRRSAPPRAPELSTELVGASAAVRELKERVTRAAQSNAPVLLWGDSGTGKQLVARLIHQQSARAPKPFIVADLSCVPDALMEDELFGRIEAGGSGTPERKPGRLELAHTGTLLLHAIDKLSLDNQGLVMRLLQPPAHGSVPAPAGTLDVRLMATSQRDLEPMIAAGRFRADLYYALSVIPIRLPPLRERKEDLRPLVSHFMAGFAERHGHAAPVLSSEAWELLEAHAFSGNVRELRNLVERLVVLRAGETINARTLHDELSHAGGAASGSAGEREADTKLDLGSAMRETEKIAIATALRKAGGNRTLAARLLGVSRRTLYNKLAEHGVTERDDRETGET